MTNNTNDIDDNLMKEFEIPKTITENFQALNLVLNKLAMSKNVGEAKKFLNAGTVSMRDIMVQLKEKQGTPEYKVFSIQAEKALTILEQRKAEINKFEEDSKKISSDAPINNQKSKKTTPKPSIETKYQKTPPAPQKARSERKPNWKWSALTHHKSMVDGLKGIVGNKNSLDKSISNLEAQIKNTEELIKKGDALNKREAEMRGRNKPHH